MARSRVTWRSNIPAVIRALEQGVPMETRASAYRVRDEARRRSRVRTGRMREGWQARQVDINEWEVANDVPYAIYNEFGTRYMTAKPMLIPALEMEEAQLAWSIKKLLEDAADRPGRPR